MHRRHGSQSTMDFRHYLQSRLPQRDALAANPWLRRFAHLLNDPALWHFGRRSVARAAGFGFLVAFVPVPIHMLLIFPLAFALRLNLPVVVGALWITNPVTWVPFFYFAYRVGLLLTGDAAQPAETVHFAADWQSVSVVLGQIWLPLCLGSLICGVVAGLTGYTLIDALWRLNIARRWRARTAQRKPAI